MGSGCPTHRRLVPAPAVVFKMDIIPQRVIGIPLSCALTQPMSQQLPSARPPSAWGSIGHGLWPTPHRFAPSAHFLPARVPSYAAAAAQASGPAGPAIASSNACFSSTAKDVSLWPFSTQIGEQINLHFLDENPLFRCKCWSIIFNCCEE
jgi:hypothetical protein